MAVRASCSKPVLLSSKEALLIIFCSAAIHLFNFYGDLHLVNSVYYPKYLYLLVTVFQGVVFLSFPLLGLAADVWLNRFCAVWIAVLLILAAATLTSVLAVVDIATSSTHYIMDITHQEMGVGDSVTGSTHQSQHVAAIVFQVLAGVALLIGMVGQGLFEANAIQFAADQMMDAPSVELSAMIHWYCWARLLFHTLLYNSEGALLLFCSKVACQPIYILLYISLIGVVLSSVSLTLLTLRRRRFAVHPIGNNPLKEIYLVLVYAKSHPQPVQRSAFTYCDDQPPTRLDFGKERFGGPFTDEQIEDTRVFLWMCLLLSTLVGYELVGDSYLIGNWLESMGYSTRPSCLLFGIDSENFVHLVVLVGVPVQQLIVAPRMRSFDMHMLRRMGVGLVFALTAVLSVTFIGAMLLSDNPSNILVQNCSSLVLNATLDVDNSTSGGLTYMYVLVIPQVFKGLAYLFVFITTLEFICAQTPNALKGVVIGFWYSLQSVQYLLVGLLDQLQIHKYTSDTIGWYVYQISKCSAIFVSIVLFIMVADRYRYRRRGEQYYQRLVIEDIYEREFDRAKKFKDEYGYFIHANPCLLYSGARHW